jgi:hypothetical protein
MGTLINDVVKSPPYGGPTGGGGGSTILIRGRRATFVSSMQVQQLWVYCSYSVLSSTRQEIRRGRKCKRKISGKLIVCRDSLLTFSTSLGVLHHQHVKRTSGDTGQLFGVLYWNLEFVTAANWNILKAATNYQLTSMIYSLIPRPFMGRTVADLENQKWGFQRNMTSELNAYSAIIKDS